jgi:CBS domain-containing protein
MTMLVENLQPATSGRLMMIAAHATVATAARALLDQNVGLLVVCGPEGEAIGVLSRLDLVRHLADGQARETLASLMTTNIVSCRPEDDLYAVWKLMARRRLRSLPVLGVESRPIGVLDLRDALKALLEQEQYQERLLEHYVAGFGYN